MGPPFIDEWQNNIKTVSQLSLIPREHACKEPLLWVNFGAGRGSETGRCLADEDEHKGGPRKVRR